MYIKRIFFVCFMLLFNVVNACFSKALIGEVSKEEYKLNRPQVIDSQTKLPVSGATVSIPIEGQEDFTDNNGYFKIIPNSVSPVILSIKKEGYRPFSLTLHDGALKGGVFFELERESPFEMILSDNLLHLGDNSFSPNSAGACLINSPCVGPSFSKEFSVGKISPDTKAYVELGSVIGIDTFQAMKLGQNKLTTAFSSPLEFFVNKNKIGELKINGDNQKIPIPTIFLIPNSTNVLTIKTGINKNLLDVDYDDVEIMNLIVEVK